MAPPLLPDMLILLPTFCTCHTAALRSALAPVVLVPHALRWTATVAVGEVVILLHPLYLL